MTLRNATTAQCVRVPGVRYRCRRREVSIRGLDPLAEFFYQRVIPKEPRVETLIKSFGLPRRVIEDVLGGLLRSNHALLDIPNAELRRIVNPEVRREHRLGDVFEVWQDGATGAFLPARMIDRLVNPQANFVALHREKARLFQDFLDAPDARIVEALRAVEPSIIEGPTPGFVLDSLTEKERLETCDLYVNLDIARVDGEEIPYVQEPAIPFWLAREWTLLLRGNGLEDTALAARTMRAVRTASAARAESILVTSRLETQLSRWLHAARDVCFDVGDAGDRFHDLRAILLKRLNSTDVIRFAPPQSDNHLQDLWERARAYMIVVTGSLTDDRVQAIIGATSGRNRSGAQLILICTGMAQAGERDLLIHRIGTPITPGMCLIDGVEGRLGDLDLLFTNASVLQITGMAALSPLVTTILQKMNYDNGGWWIRRQLQFRLSDDVAPVTGEASTIIRRLEALSLDIDQHLSTHLGDGEAEATPIEGSATDADQSQVGADLWKRTQALDFEIQSALELAGVSVFPIPAADQREILIEALDAVATAPRAGSVDLFVSDAPPYLATGSLVPLFERANAAGARIRLIAIPQRSGASPDEATVNALRLLCNRINSTLMTLSVSVTPLPRALILDGRIVVIGGESWFHAGKETNCSFVVEAPSLAAELRAAAGLDA